MKLGAMALLLSGLCLASPARALPYGADDPAYGAKSVTEFPPRLFLSADGIALSQFPGRRTLSRSIGVSLTLPGPAVSWTATSDQPWLSVTANGVTGGKLTVTADPTSLPHNQFYQAIVTVKTSGGSFKDTETLRVGMWNGSKRLEDWIIQQNATSIAANPVEPVAYVSDGGSTVVEYNVYSGEPLAEIENVAPTIGWLEVSSDGRTLFTADTTNYRIIALNAANAKLIGVYPLGYSLGFGFNMRFARPFGQPAIYAAGGPIIAFPSGARLATGLPHAFLAVPPDGASVFGLDELENPAPLYTRHVSLKNGAISLSPTKFVFSNGENCSGLAVSQNGNHVYAACGSPYEFDVYDGKTLAQVQTLPAYPYPNNAVVDADNDFVGGIDGLGQNDDVFVFNQNGFSLGAVPTLPQSDGVGQQPSIMSVSGDCTRVISATGAVFNSSQTLMFRTLP